MLYDVEGWFNYWTGKTMQEEMEEHLQTCQTCQTKPTHGCQGGNQQQQNCDVDIASALGGVSSDYIFDSGSNAANLVEGKVALEHGGHRGLMESRSIVDTNGKGVGQVAVVEMPKP